ncbi:MalY/PatB family protein [Microbacterium sp. 18062]|uniref:MalY/PatB family protein n=1 Tax=Microbacterium sp. 18062 TaxID=2681410 RepID=UPI00135C99F0|nr:aminotransferase class I/II-fold pyridoxal phosphate-dependent enzyme [Microbacterium sp. 18062]
MSFESWEALTPADLRRRGGAKWTTYPDALGTFIAESDFGTAPAVDRAVRERVEHASFGYSTKAERDAVGTSFSGWAADRLRWHVEPAQVGVLPEVLTSLELMLDHFSEPGTPVILPTPAYMPFFTLLRDHRREVIETPLLREGDGWMFDYEAIEGAFAAGARLFMLVNPANPTGTVFTREQLLPLVDIVDRHGGRVWADEIHAPILFDGRTHVPYASLSEAAAAHTVTATSASKGWNIPGLKCSQIVFTNPADRTLWRRAGRWRAHTVGYLGLFATIAAYDEGREWLDELTTHLQGHRALLGELIAEHLPRARHVPPQATYLAWLDLRDYGITGGLQSYLLREAGVAGTDGLLCGRDFDGFYRINFATPATILEELVARLGRALPA